MNSLVEVEGLSKRFRRRTALDGVSFVLEPKSVTALLGPNGAGKSTLLRCLLGLLRPDGGRVRVLGFDPVRHGERVRELVGYVPDAPDCPRWMTPRELFRFLEPHYSTWSRARAERLAAQAEVPLDTSFAALSKGQAARAMLAAALAPAPRLLLVDESFSGLDPLARRELLRHVLAELASEEIAALIATHDLDVAARIADHVLVLHEGRVSARGAVDEVLRGEVDRLPARLLELLEQGAGAQREMVGTEVEA